MDRFTLRIIRHDGIRCGSREREGLGWLACVCHCFGWGGANKQTNNQEGRRKGLVGGVKKRGPGIKAKPKSKQPHKEKHAFVTALVVGHRRPFLFVCPFYLFVSSCMFSNSAALWADSVSGKSKRFRGAPLALCFFSHLRSNSRHLCWLCESHVPINHQCPFGFNARLDHRLGLTVESGETVHMESMSGVRTYLFAI